MFRPPILRLFALSALLVLLSCHSAQRDPHTVVFLIESSPANLDPRIGTDAQSQRIDALLFDGLVARDASFQFTPALAEKWEHCLDYLRRTRRRSVVVQIRNW